MNRVTVTNPNHDAQRAPVVSVHSTTNGALANVDRILERYRIRGCTADWQPDGRIILHDPRRAFCDVVVTVELAREEP